MRFRSRVTSAIHLCIINVLILTAFFALQRHCRTCCGSLPAQSLRAHAFSVFRLVGLRRHRGGTIVPPFTLLYHMGSSPDHSSPPCQLLDDPSSFPVFVRTDPPPPLPPHPPLWIEVMLRQIWKGRVCLYVCNMCWSVPYVRNWPLKMSAAPIFYKTMRRCCWPTSVLQTQRRYLPKIVFHKHGLHIEVSRVPA